MACPACGCKTVYQYDDEDAPDDDWQRCAACGVVFHLSDSAPEDDDDRAARMTATPPEGLK